MAIHWLPPQKELIRRFGSVGMIYWEARRQFGKTTTMAGVALKQMMKHRGRLVTFASASINVGKELIYKEANVLNDAMSEMRSQAAANGMKLTLAENNGKEYSSIDIDGIADLFERSRLEMRLWHSQSVCSRTQIIAPNPATARGFSGDVLLDEIGFIPDFVEVWEAMEPIASRDPSFRVLMASTPPGDESHLCYKIGEPPEGMRFEPCGDGHWYRSQAGILTLRVDVWDGQECGVRLYDLETREPITPEQHRDRALDKDGWDRNYALKRIPGGLVAMPAVAIDAARAKGREECVALDLGTVAPEKEEIALQRIVSQVLNVANQGIWGAGYDIATTTKKKSNPSSLTLSQARGPERWVRFIVRWKSANPDFSEAVLKRSLAALKQAGARIQALNIDASNERYYATQLKSRITDCPVNLIVSGEVVETGDPTQPEMRQKERLGNLLVNTANARLLACPDVEWIKTDWLLVKKEKGLFVTELDPAGNHGDTFDSTKHSLDALESSGEIEALFPGVGDLAASGRSKDPSWMDRTRDFIEGLIYG
jgi:hypothetical protein